MDPSKNNPIASLRVDKPGKSRFVPVLTSGSAATPTSKSSGPEPKKNLVGSVSPDLAPNSTTNTTNNIATNDSIATPTIISTKPGSFSSLDDFAQVNDADFTFGTGLAHSTLNNNNLSQPAQLSPPPTPTAYDGNDGNTTTFLASPLPTLQTSLSTAGRTIEAIAADRRARQSKSISPSLEVDQETNWNGSTLRITPSESRKITMAHFLKDTGEGIPMTFSSPTSNNNNNNNNNAGSLPNKKTVIPLTRTKGPLTTIVIPQVRLVDGEIVLDEMISTMTEAPSSGNPQPPLEVINENEGRHLTSHAFVKTIGNNRWGREETDRFYQALSMCGTDFSLISRLFFPRKSREQVKGKFRVEERRYPDKVAHYLREKRPLDLEWVKRAEIERAQLEGRNDSISLKNQNDFFDSIDSPVISSKDDKASKPTPIRAVPSNIFTPSPRKSPRLTSTTTTTTTTTTSNIVSSNK